MLDHEYIGLVVKLPFLGVGFVANFSLLVAHIADPCRVFRNTSSLFVLNITIIDCIISFLWLMSYSMTVAEYEAFIKSSFSISYADAGIRIATMSAIAYFSLSLELYFSISRPLWHRTKLTHQVCRYWIVATWLFHLTLHEASIRLVNSHLYEGAFIVSYCGSFYLMIQFLNLATFISLRSNSKALRERHDVNEATFRALKQRQENEKRFLVTIAILCVIQTVTFCPYLVIKSLLLVDHSVLEVRGEIWVVLDVYAHGLIILNAMVNPFFYLWRLPKYKKTYKKFYCKCLERRNGVMSRQEFACDVRVGTRANEQEL